jgi:hypothetical protein
VRCLERTSSIGSHATCTREVLLIEAAALYTLLCHCVAGCEEYLSHGVSASCTTTL